MNNGKPLVPRIVNRGTVGSPDIHEQIFDAILHSRLVIADMTVQTSFEDDDGKLRWQPNSNVAYELGLAAAWRNPEDVLIIHQKNDNHRYNFDIQSLRHVEYSVGNQLEESISAARLADEIVGALKHSTFLANATFQKCVDSLSPNAIQFMHSEAIRVFPVIMFVGDTGRITDTRTDALAELLRCRALKNNTYLCDLSTRKFNGVIYKWTDLGCRLLGAVGAASVDRMKEIHLLAASVAEGDIPPEHLRNFPVELGNTIVGTVPPNDTNVAN